MQVNAYTWEIMQDALGFDLLACLVTGETGTSKARTKMFEYDCDPANLPENVAKRFLFVAKITNLISGSYNDLGMREWFLRKRTELKGACPAYLLKGKWDPEDEGPQMVLKFAKENYYD